MPGLQDLSEPLIDPLMDVGNLVDNEKCGVFQTGSLVFLPMHFGDIATVAGIPG